MTTHCVKVYKIEKIIIIVSLNCIIRSIPQFVSYSFCDIHCSFNVFCRCLGHFSDTHNPSPESSIGIFIPCLVLDSAEHSVPTYEVPV